LSRPSDGSLATGRPAVLVIDDEEGFKVVTTDLSAVIPTFT
jgi:hypothetical protein